MVAAAKTRSPKEQAEFEIGKLFSDVLSRMGVRLKDFDYNVIARPNMGMPNTLYAALSRACDKFPNDILYEKHIQQLPYSYEKDQEETLLVLKQVSRTTDLLVVRERKMPSGYLYDAAIGKLDDRAVARVLEVITEYVTATSNVLAARREAETTCFKDFRKAVLSEDRLTTTRRDLY